MSRLIVTLGLLVVLPGCAQTFDATTLGVPVSMAAPVGQPPAGQHFEVGAHTVHGIFGLVTISQANLEKALAGQLVGGKAVANVKIKTKTKWFDALVTLITAGLIVPRSVTYEGIIVSPSQ
jgi:hypothetical protein